jgi:starvation-inducible DNA-binding protein
MEPEFTNLHSMFEQIYQSLRMATDVIATRLSELHYDVPSQFTKPSWGFANDETESPEDLITDMISKHYSCAHEAKRVLQAADAAGDERTAHIALQRAGAHEKSAWLLSALIDSKPATHSVM